MYSYGFLPLRWQFFLPNGINKFVGLKTVMYYLQLGSFLPECDQCLLTYLFSSSVAVSASKELEFSYQWRDCLHFVCLALLTLCSISSREFLQSVQNIVGGYKQVIVFTFDQLVIGW